MEGRCVMWNSKVNRIFVSCLTVLVLSTIAFYILQIVTSQRKIESSTNPTMISNSDEQQVVDLVKAFAAVYYDGSAFINPDSQPVLESYKTYLRLEKKNIVLEQNDFNGSKLVSIENILVIPESLEGYQTFAVWMRVKIHTTDGIEKKMVFIARVQQINYRWQISTAFSVPDTYFPKQ